MPSALEQQDALKQKGGPLPVDRHVGGRVRARRQEIKMSQSVLGNVAGITFQQVQKYEQGVNRISASRLQQFATALEVDIPYFFDGASKTKREGTDDTKALMAFFARIKNKANRKKLLDLARSLAEWE